MKKLFFILIIYFLLPQLLPAAAQEVMPNPKQLCETIVPSPQINFTTSYGKLVYDFSKTKSELTELGNRAGIFESGTFAAGLALVNISYEYNLTTSRKVMWNNDLCVIPTAIDIFIGYKNPIIYMASELQPGSCTYNLVLRHEQVHQQINTEALEFFIPRFRKQINEIVKEVAPVHLTAAEPQDKAAAILTAAYTAKLNELVAVLRTEILTEQHKLDNSGNYRMEGDVCRYFNQRQRAAD